MLHRHFARLLARIEHHLVFRIFLPGSGCVRWASRAPSFLYDHGILSAAVAAAWTVSRHKPHKPVKIRHHTQVSYNG